MNKLLKDLILTLIQQVEHPPNMSLPNGVTEDDLNEFEFKTSIFLPPPLKEWLKICNGPIIGPGGIYGIPPAVDWLRIDIHLDYNPSWRDKKWIPIAGDGLGNYYVLDSKNFIDEKYPIYFIDHEFDINKPMYVVASDLWFFLFFLLQNEETHKKQNNNWPFNELYVKNIDPSINAYKGVVPLPWE